MYQLHPQIEEKGWTHFYFFSICSMSLSFLFLFMFILSWIFIFSVNSVYFLFLVLKREVGLKTLKMFCQTYSWQREVKNKIKMDMPTCWYSSLIFNSYIFSSSSNFLFNWISFIHLFQKHQRLQLSAFIMGVNVVKNFLPSVFLVLLYQQVCYHICFLFCMYHKPRLETIQYNPLHPQSNVPYIVNI